MARGCEHPSGRCQFGRHEHPVGDGLAVAETAIFGDSFDGVSRRVAEVQNASQAGFSLVSRHDLGLDAARLGDDCGQRGRLVREDRRVILSDLVEEARARCHTVLDDLVKASAELPPGERCQHRRVDDDGVRLIERADQVLAERVIDPDLAPDGAVDLCQERGRDVHQCNAAQIGGSGESGHVADDAPSEGDERGGAVGLGLDQGIVDAGDRRQLLVAFAVRHQDGFGVPKGAGDSCPMEPPNGRARDDETTLRRVSPVEDLVQAGDGAVSDRNRVGAGRGRHVDANRISLSGFGTQGGC